MRVTNLPIVFLCFAGKKFERKYGLKAYFNETVWLLTVRYNSIAYSPTGPVDKICQFCLIIELKAGYYSLCVTCVRKIGMVSLVYHERSLKKRYFPSLLMKSCKVNVLP